MPTQDTSNIKEKILSILKTRGTSLPVHIAKETGLSMLFASAFLSELVSEKKIKISYMRVGSSPIYFIPGQEPLLERFSQHLKSKEKEAFAFLQERKILKDSEQEPAIRVALRAIKDFAIPFKKNEEIFWRYFTIKEEELKVKEKIPQLSTIPERIGETQKTAHQKTQELNIFEKDKPVEKKKVSKKRISKTDEKFFNRVKDFLSQRNIEISDIESFSKKEIILRLNHQGREKLLVAYNKKRITEADIIKAHKKALEVGLPYLLLSLGEPLKRIINFIEAIKNLENIGKIK